MTNNLELQQNINKDLLASATCELAAAEKAYEDWKLGAGRLPCNAQLSWSLLTRYYGDTSISRCFGVIGAPTCFKKAKYICDRQHRSHKHLTTVVSTGQRIDVWRADSLFYRTSASRYPTYYVKRPAICESCLLKLQTGVDYGYVPPPGVMLSQIYAAPSAYIDLITQEGIIQVSNGYFISPFQSELEILTVKDLEAGAGDKLRAGNIAVYYEMAYFEQHAKQKDAYVQAINERKAVCAAYRKKLRTLRKALLRYNDSIASAKRGVGRIDRH